MTLLHNFIKKYHLIVLGGLIICLFLWFRFIRKRLPHDIPFTLKFYSLCVLTILCVTYFLLIKNLIRPKSYNKKRIIEYIIPLLYIPLEAFDTYIKTCKDINTHIYSYKDKLKYAIQDTNIFYYCFAIAPRLILIFVFFVDVFIFHKIHYLYYVIFLTILLFLHRYIIYCLKQKKNSMMMEYAPMMSGVTTKFLADFWEFTQEEQDDPDFEYPESFHALAITLERFLEYQSNCIIKHNFMPKYNIEPTIHFFETVERKYNISEEKEPEKYWDLVKKEKKIIHNHIDQITNLICLIERYNTTHSKYTKFKNIKILIFLNYFLCWFFILIMSLPYTDWADVITSLSNTLLVERNSFSQEGIYKEYLEYYNE